MVLATANSKWKKEVFPFQCVSFGTMGKYLFKPALQIILHPMKLLFQALQRRMYLLICWILRSGQAIMTMWMMFTSINHDGPILKKDTRFRFKTFGFPVEAEIIELEKAFSGQAGKTCMAWMGRRRCRPSSWCSPRLVDWRYAERKSAHSAPGIAEREAGEGFI